MWPSGQKPRLTPGYTANLRRLIDLGYLKYVPESQRRAVAEQILGNMREGNIDGDWDDQCNSSDRRCYSADNEDLSEGGMVECLLSLKEVLYQEGVKLESVEDDFRDGHYDLLVNGERFMVHYAGQEDSWAIYFKRLLEIVNELLLRAGSRERLYGMYGGNEGRVIFLTDEMYDYLSTLPWVRRRGSMPFRPDAIRTGQ
jgi:hypothetical protein